MMLRSNKKLSKEVFLHDPIGADREGNEISLLYIIEEKDVDIVKKIALDADIKKAMELIGEVLTDRERKIICLRYGLGNQKEVTQRR